VLNTFVGCHGEALATFAKGMVVATKACQEAIRLRAGQGGVARDRVDQVPGFALQEISAELLVPDFQVPAPRSAFPCQ